MKTAKLIANIFSLVIFFFIVFQSCAAGLVNVIEGNTEDGSGFGGFFLAIFMLVAGIVGLATRKNAKSGLAVAILYGIAAIIGFSSLGTFGDLVVWAYLSLFFAILFLVSFLIEIKKLKKVAAVSTETEPTKIE